MYESFFAWVDKSKLNSIFGNYMIIPGCIQSWWTLTIQVQREIYINWVFFTALTWILTRYSFCQCNARYTIHNTSIKGGEGEIFFINNNENINHISMYWMYNMDVMCPGALSSLHHCAPGCGWVIDQIKIT